MRANPDCWKIPHKTKAQALRHIRRARDMPAKAPGDGDNLDRIVPYRCATCSAWHIGHLPGSGNTRRRAVRRPHDKGRNSLMEAIGE